MQETGRHPKVRIPAALWLAAALYLLFGTAAHALINVRFTPVDLVDESQTILRVELHAQPDGTIAMKTLATLKGTDPGFTTLALPEADPVADRVKAALGTADAATALVFTGDFSAAAGDENAAGEGAAAGALHLGTAWFALSALDDGQLVIGEDTQDLATVWAGGDDMLARAVQYIMEDKRADVPPVAGTTWSGDTNAGHIDGQVFGATVVQLSADGSACLHIHAAAGDRLLRFTRGRAAEDATAGLGITTHSRYATWGDFTGDGRLDLASWDGTTLTIRPMQATGRLAETPLLVHPLPSCRGLSVVDAAGSGRAGLLVSTGDCPLLLKVGKDGTPEALPLPTANPPVAGKRVGPCAVGDFNGDGRTDVVQPAGDQLLLYHGNAASRWDVPRTMGTLTLPGDITSTVTGDFDGDGELDLLLTGSEGCVILRNQHGKGFLPVLSESGEIAYDAKPGIEGSGAFDVNQDGREDLFLLYGGMAPQFYFNRGFSCFGLAGDLALKEWGVKASGEYQNREAQFTGGAALMAGQQAGAAGDLNGDGAVDMALVSRNGDVYVLWGNPDDAAPWGLSVALPADRYGATTVIGYDGKRCLGARVVHPGHPSYFGKDTKGPLRLAWHAPDGTPLTKTVMVLAPTAATLSAEQ